MNRVLAFSIWVILSLVLVGCSSAPSNTLQKPLLFEPCWLNNKANPDQAFRAMRYTMTNMRGYTVKKVDEVNRTMEVSVCRANASICVPLIVTTSETGVVSVGRDLSVPITEKQAEPLGGWMLRLDHNYSRNRCKELFIETVKDKSN